MEFDNWRLWLFFDLDLNDLFAFSREILLPPIPESTERGDTDTSSCDRQDDITREVSEHDDEFWLVFLSFSGVMRTSSIWSERSREHPALANFIRAESVLRILSSSSAIDEDLLAHFNIII